MKKIMLLTTVLAFMGLITASAAFAGRVGHRQIKQDKRIVQGLRSGELTRGETRHLVKQQHRIQHAKHRAWSDGELTLKERAGLELHQDKASTDIYRLKHNVRDRN